MCQTATSEQKLNFVTIDTGKDVVELLRTFDVHTARCESAADSHALKAIIEATFGDLTRFNKVMRALTAVYKRDQPCEAVAA